MHREHVPCVERRGAYASMACVSRRAMVSNSLIVAARRRVSARNTAPQDSRAVEPAVALLVSIFGDFAVRGLTTSSELLQ